jgi:pilus assembly protein FimV
MNKSNLNRAVSPQLLQVLRQALLPALLLGAGAAAAQAAMPLPLPTPAAADPAPAAAPKAAAPKAAAPKAAAWSATAAEQPVAAANQSYTVLRGESLDKVIQKTMADSPLRIELLRKAFIQLNPQAFPGGQATRLRADQVLQVPDAQQLLRAVAMPLLEVTEAPRVAPPVSAQEQRRWVRFP